MIGFKKAAPEQARLKVSMYGPPRKRPDLAARNRAGTIHGHWVDGHPSPTYKSWEAMKARAHFGTGKDAPRYLGRGITVCRRWLIFQNFLADMGERPAGTTLDRIDGDDGYRPGNCRWATLAEQSANKRTARIVVAFGHARPITEWEQISGISHQAIAYRLAAGWHPDDAVSLRTSHANRRPAHAG